MSAATNGKLVRKAYFRRRVPGVNGNRPVLMKHQHDYVSYDNGKSWFIEPVPWSDLEDPPSSTRQNPETQNVFVVGVEVHDRHPIFGINDRTSA